MVYLVDDLIQDFRSDVFDRPDVDETGFHRDMLWSQADALRYANAAAAQWAADTLAYRKVMTITLIGGQALYRLPYELIEIVRASYSAYPGAYGRVLCVFNLDERLLKDDYGQLYISNGDLVHRIGNPRGVTLDSNPSFLRVYPAPETVAPGPMTLELNAVVYPQQLYEGVPLPSANSQDRHLMLLWMKKMAYAKQDADTLDLERSISFEREYRDMVSTRMHQVDRTIRGGGIVASRW